MQSKIKRCEECGRPYYSIKDVCKISSVLYFGSKSGIEFEPTIQQWFSTCERDKKFINPIYSSYSEDPIYGELIIKFYDGIELCPYCDNFILENRDTEEHHKRLNELMRLFKYKSRN